jgi:hypothetical protein
MASLPISPPLKNIGLTVKESVVKAMGPFTCKVAASSMLSKMGFEKALKKRFLIRLFISSPPPPWAN